MGGRDVFGGCGRSCAPDEATTVVDRVSVAAVVRARIGRKEPGQW